MIIILDCLLVSVWYNFVDLKVSSILEDTSFFCLVKRKTPKCLFSAYVYPVFVPYFSFLLLSFLISCWDLISSIWILLFSTKCSSLFLPVEYEFLSLFFFIVAFIKFKPRFWQQNDGEKEDDKEENLTVKEQNKERWIKYKLINEI